MMKFYIGIDLGTSGVKALLMREDGKVLGTAYRGYDIIKEQTMYAEQNMELLWQETTSVLKELVEKYPQESSLVDGISYSGQMHGLVVVDKEGNLLRNAIIWADQRSEEQIRHIYEIIGEGRYKEKIGNALSTGFMITSLMWIKENEPDIFERIGKILLPKDYIRYMMCSEIGTDVSDASSGAIFDIENGDWAWDFIEQLDMPKDIFPKVSYSLEVAGKLSAGCAKKTGLREGIKIAYGGGDTLMVGVGNGIVKPGILATNIGTSAQVSTAIDKAAWDSSFRTNTFCHVDRELWLLMGAHLSGGVALKWMKNQILEEADYDEMTDLASKVEPGCEGLVFLPYLSGERTPYNNPNARGIFFGLSLKHEKSHMIRATMEGIVYTLKQSLEIMEELGVKYERVIASGGGARSDLFLQMQADILGREIYTNSESEQGCVGAAITAAIASGAYESYEEACKKIVRWSEKVIKPNKEMQKKYEKSYQIFKQLYVKNESLF